MNSSFKIIHVENKKDFLQIAELYQKIALAGPLAQFNWNQDSALAEIKVAVNLVGFSGNLLTSFITYRSYDDRLEISALGSDPEKRQLGHVRLLLNELKNCATQQKKTIWLEVHELNEQALQLYQSAGFTVVHRRKSYYSDLADALVMTWTDGSA